MCGNGSLKVACNFGYISTICGGIYIYSCSLLDLWFENGVNAP